MSTQVKAKTNWADEFRAVSRGAKTGKTADIGSDFVDPREEDFLPDPRDVLPSRWPGGAVAHPDYDLFGRDSGRRGPARAAREYGMPRGYGARERERERERERLRFDEQVLAAEQAEEQAQDPDDFSGEPKDPSLLPGWLFGLLGILGIWGAAELLSYKAQKHFGQHPKLLTR